MKTLKTMLLRLIMADILGMLSIVCTVLTFSNSSVAANIEHNIQAGLTCRETLTEIQTISESTFKKKLRSFSESSPTGVELEIDVVSIWPYIGFDQERVKYAAKKFIQSSDMRSNIRESVYNPEEAEVIDLETLDGIKSTYSSWVRLALNSKLDFSKKILQLSELLLEAEPETKILTLTLLKHLSQLDNKKAFKALYAKLRKLIFKGWPEQMKKKYHLNILESAGPRRLLTDHLLILYTEDGKKNLSEYEWDLLLTTLTQFSHYIHLRSIQGAFFMDLGAPSDNTIGTKNLVISPPGQLYFQDSVEDRSPDTINTLTSGIELHSISTSTPSALIKHLLSKIKKLSEVESLNLSFHAHLVAPLIVNNRHKPLMPLLIRAEHARRMEMLAHMVHVVEHKSSIEHYGNSFQPMEFSSVKTFFDAFTDYWFHENKNVYLTRDRSFGFVSITGPGNYKTINDNPDGAESTFGYEVRFIDPRNYSNVHTKILEDAKWFLHQFNKIDYDSKPPAQFNSYYKNFLMNKLKKIASHYGMFRNFSDAAQRVVASQAAPVLYKQAYYLSSITTRPDMGFFEAPEYITRGEFHHITPYMTRMQWADEYRKRVHETGYEVGMLFHNWSNDPLFYRNKKMNAAIRAAQTRARQRLHGDEPTTQIVADFLLETGVYQTYLNSIREIK